MANKTTYTIDFKANYDTLTKVQKELKKIAGGSIKLDLNSKESLANLQSGLDVFIKDLEKRMKDGQIDISSFKQIQGIYKNLINEADKFKRAIVTTSVSPEFTKELEEIDKKISKAKKKAQTLKDNLKIGLGSGFELKGGKASARASTKNQAMAAGKDKARGEYGDLINELPKEINNFHKLAEAYNLVINKQGKLSRGEQAIKAVFESTAPIIKEVEESKQKELQPTIDKIEEQKKAVKDLQKEYAAKEKQSLLESKVPDNVKETNETLSQLSTTMRTDYAKSVDNATEKSKKLNKTAKESNSGFNQQDSTLGKAAKNVFTYGTALTVLRTIYRQLINTITEMDKALTSMTVVTNLSREEAWAMVGTLQQLSKETGMVTTQIADMTTKYLQQGKTLHDALILTEAAAKAATVAGIDGSRSVELLTNAVNGFQIAAEDAMLVSDKFAALAASAATDYEGLATALSKVAAQANLAGMSMDFTLGMLTKGIEVTQEAPETIGTALKTVIARMRELTDFGETLEEGMDVNRVDTALKNVGVSLLDANREFRNLDDVLTDLGGKWDTLTRNQQANVAVALAGTRQQSRLIAMMQDFDRTLELVEISQNSAGATAAQHRKYLEGLEAATNRLTTSYQGLITSFMNSDVAITVINGLSSALEFLGKNIWLVYGALGALIAIYTPLIAVKLTDQATTILAYIATIKYNKAIKEHTKAEKLLFSVKTKQALASRLVAKGMSEETAAEVANTIVTQAQTRATERQTVAQLASNAAAKANPWILLATVIVALIAAWWSLNKETEKGQQLQKSIGGLFKGLSNVLTSLLSALMPIFNILIDIIDMLIGPLTAVINIISISLNSCMEILSLIIGSISLLLNGLAQVIDFIKNSSISKTITKFVGAINNGLNKAVGWITKWTDKLFSFFKSPEQKVQELTEAIGENQEKIYEYKKYSSSVNALTNEYDELSKKTNKSAEDLKRLEEIETEIAELNSDDESFKGLEGQELINAAKAKAITQQEKANELTEENYKNLKEALKLATTEEAKALLNAKELKAAFADMVELDIEKWAKNSFNGLNITESELRNIKTTLSEISDATDFENLSMDVDEYKNKIENAVIAIEDFGDETVSTEDRVRNYTNALRGQNEEVARAIKLQYSYLELMSQLKLNSTGYSNIDLLGLTPEEIESLKTSYINAKEEQLGRDLTEEEIKALSTSFDTEFGDILNTKDQKLLINKFATFGKDLGTEFRNKLLDATGSSEDFVNDWQKSTSNVTKISEIQDKYQKGELSVYDLQEQQKTLGLTAEEMIQIVNGTYDQDKKQKEINNKLKENLLIQNQLLQSQINSGTLTEDELKGKQDELTWNNMLLDNLKNQDLYASELYKKAKAQTQLDKDRIRYNSQINQLKEKISKNEDFNREDYNGLVDYYSNLKTTYETELNKGGYLQAAINSKFVEIVDGELIWNTEQAENFRETNKEAWDWLNDNQENIPKWLEEIEKTEEEVTKAYEENSEKIISYVEQEIEAKKELLEQEKENLEKQQENYEDYWDKIDAFDEEREREKTRESIVSQLEALAGGSGSATNARRKELLSQLKDVEKEQQEAQKQAARDALTKSIDEQIASIDKEIEGWDEKLDNLGELKDISSGIDELINKIETEGIWAIPENYKTTESTVVNPNTTIPKNAKGGLVDYTGLAWVDGSLSNPEAFLSAADTQLISELVANLKIASAPNTDVDKDNNITIGTIVIQPNELKNNQDWKSAGTILAQEFKKAIRDRGLPVNAKR